MRIPRNYFLNKALKQCDFVYFLAYDIGGSTYLSKCQNTFDYISNNVKIMNNVFDGLSLSKKPFIYYPTLITSLFFLLFIVFCSNGFTHSDNTWLYAIGDEETIFIFAKNQLQKVYKNRKYREIEIDMGTSRGFLLPIRENRGLIIRTLGQQFLCCTTPI